MICRFFDTSALAKSVHPEAGTACANDLLNDIGYGNFISRLTSVEMESVLAIKVRTKAITIQDARLARKRFTGDLRRGLIEVVEIEPSHSAIALQLLKRYGVTAGLRTLDALQLATAVALRRRFPVEFVSSDARLCRVAALEGFVVIDPTASPQSLRS